MGYCWRDNCVGNGALRCSGCKTATYCNGSCQKAHWKVHKKECQMHRMVYDMEKKRADSEDTEKKPQVDDTTHCTGCGVEFEEEYGVDRECPDCGYLACESCSCSYSKGSCYCIDSNFGHAYCSQEPRHYHYGWSGRMYKGDYHPSKQDFYEINREDIPEAFESKERPCNRCGKAVHCLKKEYRTEFL